MARRLEVPESLRVTGLGFWIEREVIAEAVRKYLAGRTGCTMEATLPLTWAATMSGRPNPMLEVLGAAPAVAHRGLELRLRCVEREACGSFVAYVPAECEAKKLATVEARRREPLLVKAGERARVTMESQSMKVFLQVVCLEAGARNKRIRVRELGGTRVFLAEVTGPRQLRASLPF